MLAVDWQMAKILIRLMALVSLFVAVVLIVGSCLPRSYELSATIEIEAEPETVFAKINSLPNWQQWSTFSKQRIEGLEIEYGEKLEGVGAIQKWSDRRANGKMWITSSEPDQHVEYDLKFGEFPTMKSRIELRAGDQSTRVTWTSSGVLPNGPFYGYSALLFPTQMNYEYQQSLERLKVAVEQN